MILFAPLLIAPAFSAFPAGDPPATLLGQTVCRAGDIDGDGVEDFVAGAPQAAREGVVPGAIVAFSGATREVLWIAWGGEDQQHFGTELSNVGDVDGDGGDELLVTQMGSAYLVSCADGEFVWTIEGSWRFCGRFPGQETSHLFLAHGRRCLIVDAVGQEVGSRVGQVMGVHHVGDVTGDGVPEIARLFRERPRRIEVLEGPGWEPLVDLPLPEEWVDLGRLHLTTANLDGEGGRDFVVAAPWHHGGVVMGVKRSGRKLWSVYGDAHAVQGLGLSLAVLGDVDGDGLDDVAIGAPGHVSSRVIAVSGARGKLIWKVKGQVNRYAFDEIGADLDLLADRNDDGIPELLVGGGGSKNALGEWRPIGNVRVLSGADGEELFSLTEDDHPELRDVE